MIQPSYHKVVASLRSSKSIPLSPEVQKMLGVLKEIPPEVVIRLLLRLMSIFCGMVVLEHI